MKIELQLLREPKRLVCRFLGHKADRHHIQFDAFTFEEQTKCARCDVPLVRDPAHAWKEVGGASSNG